MNLFSEEKKEIGITLLSNNDDETEYDHNVYEFRNNLAIPLETRNIEEEWQIALQSITTTNLIYKRKALERAFDYRKFRHNEGYFKMEKEKTIKDIITIFNDPATYQLGRNILGTYATSLNAMREDIYLLKVKIRKLESNRKTIAKRQNSDALQLQYKRLTRKQKALKLRKKNVAIIYKYYYIAKINALIRFISPIFVHLSELKEDNICHKIMDYFHLKNNRLDFTTYRPNILTFFPLKSTYLNSLLVSLTDCYQRPLNNNTYVISPTILALRLQPKIMEENTYEYRTCFINNEWGEDPTDFYASLPSYLSECAKRNEWEMALLKCSIPHNFHLITNKMKIQIVERYRFNQQSEVFDGEEFLEPLYLYETEDVVHIINTSINDENYYSGEVNMTFEYNPTIEDIVEVLEEALNNVKKFKFPINFGGGDYYTDMTYESDRIAIKSNRRLIIILPSIFASVLGIDNNKLINLGNDTSCIEMDDYWGNMPEMRFVLPSQIENYDESVIREHERYYLFCKKEVNVNLLEIQNLLVYANCIEESLIGNSFGQYLTNIPIIRDENEYFTEYTPLHPEYHKMSSNNLERVTFQLTDTKGNKPKLMYQSLLNHYKTYLTLSFRRKIKKIQT